MEDLSVKDLMIPIDVYATVPLGTSLLEAIQELEKAQEAYTESKYQHRAILVLDKQNRVVGKIGQLRILKAVEARHDFDSGIDELSKFGFSQQFLAQRRETFRLAGPLLNVESLRLATEKKVEEFMQKPTPGEFVGEDCSVDIAIHRIVSGTHLSLLVTREKEIVGILRIADVFAAVSHEMKTSGLTK